MAIIKDSDLKMAKLHIKEAIRRAEEKKEDDNICLDYIITRLNEALANPNNLTERITI